MHLKLKTAMIELYFEGKLHFPNVKYFSELWPGDAWRRGDGMISHHNSYRLGIATRPIDRNLWNMIVNNNASPSQPLSHSQSSQPAWLLGWIFKMKFVLPQQLLWAAAWSRTKHDAAGPGRHCASHRHQLSPLSVLFSLGESKKEKCHSQNNISCWWRRPDNKRSERSNKSWMQPQEKTNDHGRLLLRTNNGTNKHDSLYLSNVVVLYVEN